MHLLFLLSSFSLFILLFTTSMWYDYSPSPVHNERREQQVIWPDSPVATRHSGGACRTGMIHRRMESDANLTPLFNDEILMSQFIADLGKTVSDVMSTHLWHPPPPDFPWCVVGWSKGLTNCRSVHSSPIIKSWFRLSPSQLFISGELQTCC